MVMSLADVSGFSSSGARGKAEAPADTARKATRKPTIKRSIIE